MFLRNKILKGIFVWHVKIIAVELGHKEVLDSVLEVLEDEEQVDNIMKSYKKEDESIEE